MPRRPRRDAPGRLHHVVNRAHRKDPLLLLQPDFTRLFDLMTGAVEAGRIRIHAYSLMTTHFHLLIESVDGRLSAAIQWIQSQYATYYNRTRDLGGYVHQGRFFSCPITTMAYLMSVFPYIDRNPMAAGRVTGPFLYAYGSAVHHVNEDPLPPWLEGSLVDRLIRPRLEEGMDRPEAYLRTFGLDRRTSPGDALVEARLRHPSRGRDDVDWLLSADGRRMISWLRRKARTEQRARPCLPMATAATIHEAIEEGRIGSPDAVLETSTGRKRSLWTVLEAGLLRELGGLSYTESAKVMGVSATYVKGRYTLHRQTIQEDDSYAAVAADRAAAALRKCFGPVVCQMAGEIFQRRVRKDT